MPETALCHLQKKQFVQKRISWFEKLPVVITDNCPVATRLALVQYVAKWPDTISVHSNAKKSQAEYVRTTQSTREMIKNDVKTAAPWEVYQKLVLVDLT